MKIKAKQTKRIYDLFFIQLCKGKDEISSLLLGCLLILCACFPLNAAPYTDEDVADFHNRINALKEKHQQCTAKLSQLDLQSEKGPAAKSGLKRIRAEIDQQEKRQIELNERINKLSEEIQESDKSLEEAEATQRALWKNYSENPDSKTKNRRKYDEFTDDILLQRERKAQRLLGTQNETKDELERVLKKINSLRKEEDVQRKLYMSYLREGYDPGSKTRTSTTTRDILHALCDEFKAQYVEAQNNLYNMLIEPLREANREEFDTRIDKPSSTSIPEKPEERLDEEKSAEPDDIPIPPVVTGDDDTSEEPVEGSEDIEEEEEAPPPPPEEDEEVADGEDDGGFEDLGEAENALPTSDFPTQSDAICADLLSQFNATYNVDTMRSILMQASGCSWHGLGVAALNNQVEYYNQQNQLQPQRQGQQQKIQRQAVRPGAVGTILPNPFTYPPPRFQPRRNPYGSGVPRPAYEDPIKRNKPPGKKKKKPPVKKPKDDCYPGTRGADGMCVITGY